MTSGRFVRVATATAVMLLIAAPVALASPTRLLLPGSTAFAVLGHSCGGIQEKPYATGFDPTSGYPTGEVYISTSCGGSGRDGGGHTTVYSAWVAVTWDFTGVMVSYSTPGSASVDPALSAYDANGNEVYNQYTVAPYGAYLVLAPGYVPVPRFLSLSVSQGPASGGTSVSITGTGFTNATAVDFGSTPAAAFTVNNDNSITATSPDAAAGTVDVTVTSAGGTSATGSSDQFTFVARPVVSGISPNSGPVAGGGYITVSGENLAAATSVSFGGTPTPFTVNPDGSLSVYVVPSDSGADSVDITVTSVGGTSASTVADQYTYVSGPPPVVSTVSPHFGPVGGGTTVTILGLNFTPDSTVKFGSTPADSTYVSSTKLTAVSPGSSPGAVAVTVTTPGGTSASIIKDLFAYGPPGISSFTPGSGITGSAVTITGSGFAPGLTVTFGPLPATGVRVLSGTSVVAKVPNGATPGAITVKDPRGSSSSASPFTPTLSITGFSPSSGPAGAVVTVRGIGFEPSSVVRFGGVAAAGVTYVSSGEMKATVPAGARTGRITVTNSIAPKGTVRSAGLFTVS